MTPSLYYQCMLAGVLGILFHMLVIKYPELRKRAKAANTSITLKQFIADDWPAMIASFVMLIIAIVVVDELLRFQPGIINYIKFFFAAMGYTGSSVLQVIFGVASKKILSVIDEKTNIADGITDGITESKTPVKPISNTGGGAQ